MAFYSSPYQIYKENNKIENKTLVKTTKSSEVTADENNGSGIKTNYIRVQKLSEYERFYNNPDFANSDKVRASILRRTEEKLKKPILLQEDCDSLYNTGLEQKLRNKKKESDLKEIFSSRGFYESSFSSNIVSPCKLSNKIPNKGLEVGISEVIEECKENKKFRRNSCHTFSGKTGFYVC